MRIRWTRPLLLLTAALFVLSAALVISADDAWAHGGRVKPKPPMPGDGAPPTKWPKKPPPTTPPAPTPWPSPPPKAPTTPPPSKPPFKPSPKTPSTPPPGPTPGTNPGGTTPPPSGPPKTPTGPGNLLGRGRRGAAAGSGWQTWWELNRWRFFPERGSHLIRVGAVVTPAAEGPDEPIDSREVAERRRALVARQHVVPFLLRMLDPGRRVRDEVRSAALIALAKITQDQEAVALVQRYAADEGQSNLVRESAALAIGLLRRTSPSLQMAGDDLDRARGSLIALVDDEKAPERTRSFAALAIGLLGDQPHGSAFSKDGRVVTRALWSRLAQHHASREIPVALLTAIGMQPAGGTSDEIKKGLQRIAIGRRTLGRTWDAYEQSHALRALVGQRGPGWEMALFRTVTAKRLPAPARQAAFIALGSHAGELSPADRLKATDAALKGIRYARDPVTRGLGLIGLGRLLGSDLDAGSAAILDRTTSDEFLLGEARNGSRPVRGFAALGVALAARDVKAHDLTALEFLADARETLLQGFQRTTEPDLRGAYAASMGLCAEPKGPTVGVLTDSLTDRGASPDLRGHAAVALAQLGVRTPAVLRALRTALWDRRTVALRSEAALALSFLGGRSETAMLVQELRNARSQWVLAQISVALGQLGDLEAVPAIMEVAQDERRSEEARALAIASLGLLVDPEPKPSMLGLTFDANYPSRTDALGEAFTIL